MPISRNEGAGRGTVVIGLGNPLLGDDGVGIAALERLRERWVVPADVELADGGTWGMTLLPLIEGAQRVVFLDAIDSGAAPGADVVIPRDRLPRMLAMKTSPHQVDLQDVLALAELRGTLPRDTIAIGVQPAQLETPYELSGPVRARLDDLVGAVVRQLADWGHECTPRAPVPHA